MRNTFIKLGYVFILLLLGFVNISAKKIDSSANLFRNGDKVCFIGNSITHDGDYHSLIYLFYLTRFPELRLDVFNCGISGHDVANTLKRFKSDIAVHHPTVATIKLGTNDVNRDLYFNPTPQKDAEKLNANAFYKTNMKELVRKLDSIKTNIIFLTPAYFEDKPRPDKQIVIGLNEAFEQYGQFLDSLRINYKTSFVDFHFIMDSISKARQKSDPNFSLIGSDRVHPSYDGHFVMAYAFLKALNVSSYISKTEIDVIRKKVLDTDNCTLSDLDISKNQLSFKLLEKSLPFPVSAYSHDTSLVPFTKMFNQEVLKIKGLSPDKKYKLSIDTVFVAELTGKQLLRGINLALIPVVPQVKQAEKVAVLNKKRRLLSAELRYIKLVEYNSLKPDELLLGKEEKRELLTNILKSMEGNSWYHYNKKLFTDYIENVDKQDQKIHQLDEYVKEIYRINQPVPHHYKLTLIH